MLLQVMYGMDYVNAERDQQHAYLRQTVMSHVQRHPQVRSELCCTGAALQHGLHLLLLAGVDRQRCNAAGLQGAVVLSHSSQH